MDIVEAAKDANHAALIIAAFALLIANQVLGLFKEQAKDWWDHKRGNGAGGAIVDLRETVIGLQHSIESLRERLDGQPPYPQCYYDNEHFERVKRIEEDVRFTRESQQEQRRMIDAGNFTCRVRGEHLRTIQRVDDRLDRNKEL
jgi:hypothetical protein